MKRKYKEEIHILKNKAKHKKKKTKTKETKKNKTKKEANNTIQKPQPTKHTTYNTQSEKAVTIYIKQACRSSP